MPRLCRKQKRQPAVVQRTTLEHGEGDRHKEQHTHLSCKRQLIVRRRAAQKATGKIQPKKDVAQLKERNQRPEIPPVP
jgi:hypothetical protein